MFCNDLKLFLKTYLQKSKCSTLKKYLDEPAAYGTDLNRYLIVFAMLIAPTHVC